MNDLNTPRPPRLAIKDLRPYDASEPAAEVVLSANESPVDLPPEVLAQLKAEIHSFPFRKYPDPLATSLRELLAQTHNVTPDQILVGNGGDELILDLILAWGGPGRTLLTFPPTFSMYAIYAHTLETNVVEVLRDSQTCALDEKAVITRISKGDIDLCILANPNNPSGTVTELDFLRKLCKASDALVLVDEAYYEFSHTTAASLLNDCPNLVILHTFSKAYALAGLRLGYLLADPSVIATLKKVRMPYSVNAFTQRVGELICRNRALFAPTIASIINERDRLYSALLALNGVTVWPSQANYLLFRVDDAARVWQCLLDEYSIYIRDFSSAPGLTNCLRVTIGTAEENTRFFNALSALLCTSAESTSAPLNNQEV